MWRKSHTSKMIYIYIYLLNIYIYRCASQVRARTYLLMRAVCPWKVNTHEASEMFHFFSVPSADALTTKLPCTLHCVIYDVWPTRVPVIIFVGTAFVHRDILYPKTILNIQDTISNLKRNSYVRTNSDNKSRRISHSITTSAAEKSKITAVS